MEWRTYAETRSNGSNAEYNYWMGKYSKSLYSIIPANGEGSPALAMMDKARRMKNVSQTNMPSLISITMAILTSRSLEFPTLIIIVMSGVLMQRQLLG